MPAIRSDLERLLNARPHATHAGLLLSRYLAVGAGDLAIAKERPALLAAAVTAARNGRAVYQKAFDRWAESLPPGTHSGTFRVESRLITGLGSEHPLETGITLHHTYGTPILPGTGLKGLAAHYCDQVWGGRATCAGPPPGVPDAARPAFRRRRGNEPATAGDVHRILFGTTDDAGHVTFHDAWMEPSSLSPAQQGKEGLLPDVMTPHHADYYMSGGSTAPTDFDDPNPVAFLSVAGRFRVAVSCDVPGDRGKNWSVIALDLLRQALADWGLGGKTGSGYGRLSLAEDPSRAIGGLAGR